MVIITAMLSMYFAGRREGSGCGLRHLATTVQGGVVSTCPRNCYLGNTPTTTNKSSIISIHYKIPLLLSILLSGLISTQSFLQMAFPSIIWNPAVWGSQHYYYFSKNHPIWSGGGLGGLGRVYLPKDLEKELQGGCFTVDSGGDDDDDDDIIEGGGAGAGAGATFRSSSSAVVTAAKSSSSSTSSSSSSSLLRSSSSSSSSTTNNNNNHHRKQQEQRPLCLTEQQWSHLSSGTLSSHNPTDVATVYRGLSYLQSSKSKGLIINALARNIKESIPDLRRNIEALLPFLGNNNNNNNEDTITTTTTTTKLTFVVFENDSVDGTRDELIRWAAEVNNNHPRGGGGSSSSRYNVDLIQCPPPNTDCKLNIIDRNDINGGTNKTASGVGKLGDFRQIVVDHVIQNYGEEEYSHMIVLDVDLGVSVSPLGIVHTLGLKSEEEGGDDDFLAEKYVVASAATQVWPGTFGTM